MHKYLIDNIVHLKNGVLPSDIIFELVFPDNLKIDALSSDKYTIGKGLNEHDKVVMCSGWYYYRYLQQ